MRGRFANNHRARGAYHNGYIRTDGIEKKSSTEWRAVNTIIIRREQHADCISYQNGAYGYKYRHLPISS